MATALSWFFTERVFGPDRAAMLTTQLPASAASQAKRRDGQTAAIRRKIARLDHNRDHITRSCWRFDQAHWGRPPGQRSIRGFRGSPPGPIP